MSREARRVPAKWVHPVDARKRPIPLIGGSISARQAEWDADAAKWAEGLISDYKGGWRPIPEQHRGLTFAEWDNARPTPADYMPDWPAEERTHWQMYETCTDGTPISPVLTSPETLARWLVDHEASAFGSMTATYEGWLATIYSEHGSISMVAEAGTGVMSGVDFLVPLCDEHHEDPVVYLRRHGISAMTGKEVETGLGEIARRLNRCHPTARWAIRISIPRDGAKQYGGHDMTTIDSITDNLSDANLSGADLSDADLSCANLSDADLSDADLSCANLSDADLSDADLRRANLSNAGLRDANLSNANLGDADLRDADLSGADLRRADLRRANLSNASLRRANLSNANLSNADLRDADLSCANLGAVFPRRHGASCRGNTMKRQVGHGSLRPIAGFLLTPGTAFHALLSALEASGAVRLPESRFIDIPAPAEFDPETSERWAREQASLMQVAGWSAVACPLPAEPDVGGGGTLPEKETRP